MGVAVLVGLAVALALHRPGPRGSPGDRPEDAGATTSVPAVLRFRLVLSGLAGAATAVFLGGLVGLAAAAPAAWFAWRVLGRVGTADERRRARHLERELPGAVDLLVAALRVGLAPGAAIGVVADAVPGPVGEELSLLHHRLTLGADPAVVWRELSDHPQLGPLGRALGRAHARGAAVVPAGERLAAELRERSEAAIEAQARSVSTRAAAPLGACFLPAFVLLGIVPLVAGLLGSLHLFG